MSLTIRESLTKLAVALNVDPTNMPTSNIADAIDYIANEHAGSDIFDHTGVISTSIDHLSEGLGGPEDATEDEGGNS